MVREGLCDVLVSDYVWAAMLPAAFRVAQGAAPGLAAAWRLVSANPAAALRLADRGRIVAGARADLVLVDPSGPVPRVVATFVAGRPVLLGAGLQARARAPVMAA
jgi:alpha-D-ribose 1-methylphosphonate 5-triphosphate diphosphatase